MLRVLLMSGDDFNGWVNRETWAAALHLSNDEGLYGLAVELAASEASAFRAGEVIAAQVEEWAELLFHGVGDGRDHVPSVVVMMLDEIGSRWRVDWTAVAESFREDAPETPGHPSHFGTGHEPLCDDCKSGN